MQDLLIYLLNIILYYDEINYGNFISKDISRMDEG